MSYKLIMYDNPIVINKDDWYIDFLVLFSQNILQHSGIEYENNDLNSNYKNPIIQSKQGTTSPKNNCWKVIAGMNDISIDFSELTEKDKNKIGYIDNVLIWFEEGFKYTQSQKNFSLDDIKYAIKQARNPDLHWKEIIQSLYIDKIFDIEGDIIDNVFKISKIQ